MNNEPDKGTLRSQAERNISAKLGVLNKWASAKKLPWRCDDSGRPARDEDGQLIIEYFPKNPASFAAWDGSQNCPFVRKNDIGAIKSLSRMTLDQPYHANIKADVIAVILTLKKFAKKQMLEADHATQIEILTSERDGLNALVDQQERDIAQFRARMIDTENELRRNIKIQHEGNSELQKTIADLERRNAELASAISSLIPLKLNKKL